MQYQQKLTRMKWLMIPIDHIVDMVRLDLQFVEDFLNTIILKRLGRLFCVWMLEGSESVRTFVVTSSITTRNRVGQLKVHTKSTYVSVICWK